MTKATKVERSRRRRIKASYRYHVAYRRVLSMCPNGDAATAIDAYVVRGGYADVAELAAAARAFDAVEGEDRGVPTASPSIVIAH